MITRREFVHTLAAAGMAGMGVSALRNVAGAAESRGTMQFGLVTYQWGKDLDLPTLIDVCEKAELPGLELRTEHAHKVEPNLSKAERQEVRKRFADSSVTLVGYGSNAEFHSPDPAEVQRNIELAQEYVKLMHDCGGSGVKVKPNTLPKDVPPEKTIAQIGEALNQLGAYGEEFGQQIRVEVHGRRTSELPVMKAIFDLVDHPNVGICWNCNLVDLEGDGLEHNFNLVKDRLGATVHIHDLTKDNYPWEQFIGMLKDADYSGWLLLEDGGNPDDKVAALIEQRKLFEELTRDK